MIIGKHLIRGAWIGDAICFENEPVSGEPDKFSNGRAEQVDLAAQAAEEAF